MKGHSSFLITHIFLNYLCCLIAKCQMKNEPNVKDLKPNVKDFKNFQYLTDGQ